MFSGGNFIDVFGKKKWLAFVNNKTCPYCNQHQLTKVGKSCDGKNDKWRCIGDGSCGEVVYMRSKDEELPELLNFQDVMNYPEDGEEWEFKELGITNEEAIRTKLNRNQLEVLFNTMMDIGRNRGLRSTELGEFDDEQEDLIQCPFSQGWLDQPAVLISQEAYGFEGQESGMLLKCDAYVWSFELWKNEYYMI